MTDTTRETLIGRLFTEANKADDVHADLMREAADALAATPEQAPAVQAGALTDERIDAAWWSLGTEPDGSNLAGGCTLAGWRRAVRWAEATLATTPAVQAEQPAGWSTPPSTWQESEAHAAPRGQAEDAQRLEYGSLGFGWTFAGIELADGDKRLMSMLVNAFGSDHPAVADLTALLFRARASDARKGEAS